ncbi:hypothetical protein RclHR1_05100002 [Rhizophagus clarus]|uniref:TLDc domain-containing protein n=1 Tax=Rhizophagus clarus TaxID=94130 RepID=A0A2Z6RKW6_9GLOM|nr:hypothetical protein RclHR1_05100002 [Rhizophagus clarus]
MKPKANVPQSRKPNFGSTLIQRKHFPLFASWIDKEDSSHYGKKNIPYDFKLLYHSGRDGFDAASFHKNCDNKGATIWVAKIQGSTILIGGYNPLDWSGDRVWKYTTDSFLFNLADGKDISTTKVGYPKIPNYGICCEQNQGPHMGVLVCNGNNNWQNYDINAVNYPSIGIPYTTFAVDNYEVFHVIKK